jgi:zeta-carotene isomerase
LTEFSFAFCAARYGDAFEAVKSRTSIVPFAALVDGRQKGAPENWWLTEFARAPYIAITVGTVGAYFAHPLLEGGATLLHW